LTLSAFCVIVLLTNNIEGEDVKKFLLIVLGCLLGLANGFFYFFATSFAYEAFTYSIALIALAFVGFTVICLLNTIFFLLTKKRASRSP